jgi:hypothetical protein
MRRREDNDNGDDDDDDDDDDTNIDCKETGTLGSAHCLIWGGGVLRVRYEVRNFLTSRKTITM